MKGLRTLASARLAGNRQAIGNQRMRRAAFATGLLAAIVEYAISARPLTDPAIDHSSPGGNPLVKLYPGTDIERMYFDDRAQVQSQQRFVLNPLNLHDALFGVPLDQLSALEHQIAFGRATTGIGNFWLGVAAHPLGWMLIPGVVLVGSRSDSLGPKTDDLTSTAACMIAMMKYPRSMPARRQAITTLRRISERLSERPFHANLAGFKP